MKALFFVIMVALCGAQICQAEVPPQFILQWGERGSANGQFDSTAGIAIDSHGVIYVLDGNSRVQKFDSQGNYLGSWPFIHGGNGLAIDANDNVYVAIGWGGIQKFDSQGNYLAPIWEFNAEELAFDRNGDLLLASTREIIKLDTDGNLLLEWGYDGPNTGEFSNAAGIAVDSQNNVYVGDGGYSQEIRVFDNNGNFLRTFGHGQITDPFGITIDDQDNVYVSEYFSNRISKFTSEGTLLTSWGSSWDSPGTGPGEFDRPQDLVIGSDGSIYVCDEANYRIQKFGYLPIPVLPTTWSAIKARNR